MTATNNALMHTLVDQALTAFTCAMCHSFLQGATPAETDKLLEDREHEAIANLQHLTNLKLLHPPRAREQIQRWQELLSETVALLKLLSSADCTPSNTAAASAALLQAQGLEPPSAQAKVSGLLHGVPQDERTQRQVWRQLSNHIHRLLVLLDREVGGSGWLVAGGGGVARFGGVLFERGCSDEVLARLPTPKGHTG